MSSHRVDVITTPEADDDLRSIALYGIDQWGHDRALDYTTEIAKVLNALSRFPAMGRRVEDAGDANLRFVRARDHVVYYETDERAVTVLRILHKRMSPSGQPGGR